MGMFTDTESLQIIIIQSVTEIYIYINIIIIYLKCEFYMLFYPEINIDYLLIN